MRRNEKLVKEALEIQEILDSGELIRIAMVDAGEPYLVPMSYGCYEGVIYLHCANEGRKIDVLKENNRVCFEVSCDTRLVKKVASCGWTYHFRSVIGRGRVSFVEDYNEKLIGLSSIMEQYGSSEHSFPESAVEITTVLRIDIDEITGKESLGKPPKAD